MEVATENPIKGDSLSIPELNEEPTSDELEAKSPMENESQGEEEEKQQQDPALEQGEYGKK